MKIFQTIELVSALILIAGEWQFWSKTYNWRNEGDTTFYTHSAKVQTIRYWTRYGSAFLAIVGLIYLIWI